MAVTPGERTELVTTGLYRSIRHPIYALSILLVAASAVNLAGHGALSPQESGYAAIVYAIMSIDAFFAMVSIVLALAVLFARYSGTSVPLLTGDVAHFYGLLAAYVILLLGCIMRGL